MKLLKVLLGTALMALVSAAGAHTMTIGYANAGPGSVTFWFGSWHDLVPPLFEGSMQLEGVAPTVFAPTVVNFTLSAGCNPGVANCPNKPAGLVDGTTNFYSCASPPVGQTLCASDVDGNGPVNKWQGVTFNNLQAGTYRFTYLPIANPSADWRPDNEAVRTNVVTLSGSIVSGVEAAIPTMSEWAMILMGLLLAGSAMTVLRRR
jgi:hypothetical protein